MLKKAASFVLTSLEVSTYGEEYASTSRSLRPCWTTFLNILKKTAVNQFIEQEPGPLGSPHEPQAPGPLEPAQSAVAPTPKDENCFCSLVALQDGHAGVAEPRTSASNRWLHSWQRYSKMGMLFSRVRHPL